MGRESRLGVWPVSAQHSLHKQAFAGTSLESFVNRHTFTTAPDAYRRPAHVVDMPASDNQIHALKHTRYDDIKQGQVRTPRTAVHSQQTKNHAHLFTPPLAHTHSELAHTVQCAAHCAVPKTPKSPSPSPRHPPSHHTAHTHQHQHAISSALGRRAVLIMVSALQPRLLQAAGRRRQHLRCPAAVGVAGGLLGQGAAHVAGTSWLLPATGCC